MIKSKTEIFNEVRSLLNDHRLTIMHEDQSRPWGGFFVLDEHEIETFSNLFFSGISPDQLQEGCKLSPKVLLVAPGCRLSWQYHDRRAELWTVIRGPVQINISDTNEEKEIVTLGSGALISLRQGQRHRLIGLDDWGIVAEIWQHANADFPSDEEDIVRVQDDYNRQNA